MGAMVVRDGSFVGVAAASSHLATAAVAAIQAEWKSEPQPSSKELFDYLKKNTEDGSDPTGDGDRFNTGNVDEGLASATYVCNRPIRFLTSHMFRSNLALRWRSGTATIDRLDRTQRPFGVRGELAEAFRIPEDRVRVLMPDTVRDMAASIRGRRRSRPPDWRAPPSVRSKWCGPAKRNSHGRTFVRRE